MFEKIIESLKSYNNNYILITTILIVIFEFFVDMPAFKKAKLKRDVKVLVLMNVALIIIAISLIVLNRM
ncbi:MAG: hypothetical protein GX154_06210 [Clostridiales bacterium]|nr:hypothetical protein [Clostridiales bacterium]